MPRRPTSTLGRLLQQLSWSGSTIRDYRDGGHGYENVLTAEAFQGLDFLPRRGFLGSVIEGARGADKTRAQLVSEIERATFTLLPGNQPLVPSGDRHQTRFPVQPDGLIESESTFVVLEAKRIRRSSFQPQQLAREFVLALRDAGNRRPLLFLVLGSEPPVRVAGHGSQSIPDAIALHLGSVLKRAEGHALTAGQAMAKVPDVVCWTTWQDIAATVRSQLEAYRTSDASTRATITRLAESVTEAIERHS